MSGVRNKAIIVAYKKGYRVSECGNSVVYKERERKLQVKNNFNKPYLRFSISLGEGKSTNIMVHRLMAYQKYKKRAFKEGIVIRHKNDNSLDNSKKNILLGTQSINMKEKFKNAKKKIEEIEIIYLPLPNGEKLVSWHRHDFKSVELPEGYFMIDGGQEDYCRFSSPDSTILPVKEKLLNCFDWVRDSFTWTSRYDKDMKLLKKPLVRKLKELDSDHLENLAVYRGTSYMKQIFLMELKFRENEGNNSRR